MAFKRKKKASTAKKTTTATKKSTGKIKYIRTEVDGIMFASKMESEYYLDLKADLAAGRIAKFELQPKFVLQEKFIVVNGEIIYGSDDDFNRLKRKHKAETIREIAYIADFLVTYNDGTQKVIDTKGRSTTEFEIKKKMFLHKYPMHTLNVLIWNKETSTWDDYYEYNKAKRAKKKAKTKA